MWRVVDVWTIELLTLFRGACGIEVGDKFVVTGGRFSKSKVAQYTEAGVVTIMPKLKTGRYLHACSKFVNDDGDTVSSLYTTVLNYTANRHYWLLEGGRMIKTVIKFLLRRSLLALAGPPLDLYLLD